MRTSHFTRRSLVATCLVALVAAACQNDAPAPVAPTADAMRAGAPGDAFEVYTQNVYLGGETSPILTLDFNDIGAVLAATGKFWGDVQASDIPARAAKFVDVMATKRPDVVTLEEAFQYVVLDGSFNPTGGADLLGSIQEEIARRKLPYEVAVIQVATTGTLPLAFDPATGEISQWLSFADRVVILKRIGVKVLTSDHGLYGARLDLGPVVLVRGWARITFDHDGTPVHLVATHLEEIPEIQEAQSQELQSSVLAGLDGITVIAGDLNSDAAAREGAPTWTATYGELVAAGFTDGWLAAPHRPGTPAVTCCQLASLKGPSQLDQRIDFVLVRTAKSRDDDGGLAVGGFRADLVGDSPADRTADGLWPSDHAGLVVSLKIAGGRRDR